MKLVVEKFRRKAIRRQLQKINARELNIMHDLIMAGRRDITGCAMKLGVHLISELLENDRSHLCGEPNERDGNR